MTVLNIPAPLKTTFPRRDNPFMAKELQKAIMNRSQLKNWNNKEKNYENWYLYEKQRNFCVTLLRKTQKTSKT